MKLFQTEVIMFIRPQIIPIENGLAKVIKTQTHFLYVFQAVIGIFYYSHTRGGSTNCVLNPNPQKNDDDTCLLRSLKVEWTDSNENKHTQHYE